MLIRAEFPNPDRLLLPGQFVTVVIERREALDKVVVPQAAVLTDQAGHYVLLVDAENKVESRHIQTGQRFGSTWVVEEGLRPGERIVLHGIQKVRPGLTVEPELTEAPSDPSTRGDTIGRSAKNNAPTDTPIVSPASASAGDETDQAVN